MKTPILPILRRNAEFQLRFEVVFSGQLPYFFGYSFFFLPKQSQRSKLRSLGLFWKEKKLCLLTEEIR